VMMTSRTTRSVKGMLALQAEAAGWF